MNNINRRKKRGEKENTLSTKFKKKTDHKKEFTLDSVPINI